MLHIPQIGMMQDNHPNLLPDTMYRLTMHCGLELEYHGVSVMFMNTCSLVLCFYPKSSFVMYDDNVILNPIFAYL